MAQPNRVMHAGGIHCVEINQFKYFQGVKLGKK